MMFFIYFIIPKSERVASRIGDGKLSGISTHVVPGTYLSQKSAKVNAAVSDSIVPNMFSYLRSLTNHMNSHHTTYWQHGDHLGSASWVTDTNGLGYQHLQYTPWGEPFIEQHVSGADYAARYTFSGKERDEETGFSYFGARHYNSLTSTWLSVDPLSDKYPGVSPYVYCNNNPVRLVDPDGREVIVTGEASSEVILQINNQTSRSFKVSINNEGKMTYEGKAKTRADRLIKKAIESPNETINIIANNSNSFVGRDGNTYSYEKDENGNFYGGGAYGGCEVVGKHSTSYQYVNPSALSSLDKRVGDDVIGGYMLHEFAEGFFSAYLGHRTGSDCIGGDNYEYAHCRANEIMGGGWFAKTVPYKITINTNNFYMPHINIRQGITIVDYGRSGN